MMIIVWILVIPIVLFVVSAGVVGIYQAETESKIQKEADKIANLVQGSNLRSIMKISQSLGITEDRIIAAVTNAIKRSENESNYFSDAYIDFDKMEIIFPEKLRDWTCSYCRTINPSESFSCLSCLATYKE